MRETKKNLYVSILKLQINRKNHTPKKSVTQFDQPIYFLTLNTVIHYSPTTFR